MSAEDMLYSQGFGTRRVCAGLIQRGSLRVQGRVVADAGQPLALDGLQFELDGEAWPYQAKAYLMLHKPEGTECSQKPSAWPSVYTLLPAPLRQRPVKGSAPGVQAVGRLDQDTTGLLLLSDDGTFIHRMSSPKRKQPKVYEVSLKHAATPALCQALLAGVQLVDERETLAAHAAELVAPQHLRLTLLQGKYHQVKRMVAAAGNRVEGLHRSQIGQLKLDEALAPGHWRWLRPADLAALDGQG
ncbi:16S rRNA pseudouridine(516) synthase [Comamonas serinivorans]|uniref:Pseudouridine synthase n=1 Tax=Comamonas serinivorans TaxID=1082851 RepID=A0A1Y0ETW9_9BURK|nr:16S rRNA pseudouridine(516) synthase [Comamonas serinivorans]ARU06890.1 16S rRNA pseudouridine(516) synthase [Comamonas serinivorans]